MHLRTGIRWISYSHRLLNTNAYKIAIIGTGPGGFYTAHHLLNKSSPDMKLSIDFFERLPTPFGLSRYGVAPDHPEVKNCEEYLVDIMNDFGNGDNQRHSVRFLGNVDVGKDISLDMLQKHYNSVVLAYGCTAADNKLNIPGGDNLPGVMPARQFVNWYNGHPDYYETGSKFIPPSLDKIEDVSIIGNGNVALDVARILLADPKEHWARTDISTEAQALLEKSTVKNVRIVGRRGVLESAFSNKEIRELFELENASFIPMDDSLLSSIDRSNLGRVNKRKLSIIEKFNVSPKEDKTPKSHTWSLEYLKSPIKFTLNPQDPTLLASTTFVENELVHDPLIPYVKCKPTSKQTELKNELVIVSIGYQGTPLTGFEELGIWFENNKLQNKQGRVLSVESKDNEHNAVFKTGFYTAGWIKTGPKGVIATTMMDSFDTADKMLEDLTNNHALKIEDERDITQVLNKDIVHWKNWGKLDAYELEKGKELGKVRYKVCNKQEMLERAL
ncbi:ARH1 [[Candida] subhashii]|uniref:NADPH:adrenodoxin oxidoreductase, mitochondrial n=1 Tax=[Candida] subhashii TaxID=561895 RepID=A0A8J5QRM8_9ASCO|nr:ARH1 [[Candida] subhashii]KAG7665183.1 ARH1 [[Candida] subhashii]